MKIIVDLDGCVFDPAEFVKKYLYPINRKANQEDWNLYLSHTREFPVIEPIAKILRAIDTCGCAIIYLSGRPESNREDTLKSLAANWLNEWKVILRPADFDTKIDTHIWKLSVIKEIKPDLIIEDEPRAVKAFVDAGFLVLQVHGTRISDSDQVPLI